MIKYRLTDQGLVFSVNINGHDIHFKEWSATDDCIYYFPLATLVDNGNASFFKNECTVPFESLYLFDDSERALLDIPIAYDKAIRLHGDGMLNTKEFKYELELLTHVPDGQLLKFERQGNIISSEGKLYLLSPTQYELMEKVAQFNEMPEELKTTDSNLREFAEIKSLALESGCSLDSYLENENVFVPGKVKIELDREENGFTVKPSVDIEEKEKFTNTFEKMRRVQNIYPVANDRGERTRVVLNGEQAEALQKIKSHPGKNWSQDELKAMVENPTEFFDPDQIDLSEFYSDRVIEIGLYKPKFYPFVCPYKSCWIAGATVETPSNGTTKIAIQDEETLAEFESMIQEAESKDEPVVNYNDAQIDIQDARYLAKVAREQLSHPKEPVISDKSLTDDARKVLIIEENAENLGFVVERKIVETGGKFTLFRDDFLNEKFSLKEHQQEGVAWLQHLYNSKAPGCLMADDMGLGKTLQILYFIDWHSRKYPDHKPYLIVAPVSLLENWQNEYLRFFSNPMKVTTLTSGDVPRQFNRTIIDQMQKQDIVLTNYESLRISQMNFCAVEFDVIALDEAQKIKSPGTLVTNAAKALKGNFRIAMTGTPVENTLLDLWCIMDFCVPGLLGNAKSFAAKYQHPLKNADTDIVALGNEVHDLLGIYFMRRLKKDAAKDLPNKFEVKKPLDMPSVQEATYVKVVNDYVSGVQSNMLTTIQDIRTVSEHPYLFEGTLPNYNDTKELISTSSRLKSTISFLDEIKNKGEKVILFAERKDIQRMLQMVVHRRYGLSSTIINGDTPAATRGHSTNKLSRQSSIDEFQKQPGFNVIIMSPIAAGMGLNVTAANNVIHYSRHWNPAKENQATDRAYRIGQTKDVYVYYPMATSPNFKAFDVTLDELLSRKTALASSTIFPTERIEVKDEELGQMLFGQKL